VAKAVLQRACSPTLRLRSFQWFESSGLIDDISGPIALINHGDMDLLGNTRFVTRIPAINHTIRLSCASLVMRFLQLSEMKHEASWFPLNPSTYSNQFTRNLDMFFTLNRVGI